MKLTSRNILLKEADLEIQKIRKTIKEREIKSQYEWDKFVEDERMAEINTEKWKNQVLQLAKKGKINIDLKSLNDEDKFKAKSLINRIEYELAHLEGRPNILGYSNIYPILVLLNTLLALFGGAIMYFFELNDATPNTQLKNKKKMELIKKIKDIPTPKSSPPIKMLKWIKSFIGLIKK